MLFRLDKLSCSTSPVSLSTLKAFVRFYDDSDDALLNSFLTQCTELAENYLSRKISTTQYKWTIARPNELRNRADGIFGSDYFSFGWSPFQYSNNKVLELPYTPVQSIDAVSYGSWETPVDTFLVSGTDYYADIATDPARIRLVTSPYDWCQDHLSVVFTSGYGQTSTLTTTGAATVNGSVALTVAGQPVSVGVTSGDTAQTFTLNVYAALAGIVAAQVVTPTMLSLAGPNALAVVTSPVPGLTITASAPLCSLPVSVTQAIVSRAANLYRAMGRPEYSVDDAKFYQDLAPWRFFAFPRG